MVWQQDFAKLARSGSVRVSLLEEAVTRCVTRGRPLLLLDLCGDPPPLLTNVLTRTITEEGWFVYRVFILLVFYIYLFIYFLFCCVLVSFKVVT